MGPALGAALWNRDATSLRRRAVALEALGFESLTVGDHLGYLSPLPACAVIAASLHGWRGRLGITRLTVFADRPELQPAEAMEPVLELL